MKNETSTDADIIIEVQKLIDNTRVGALSASPELVDFITKLERILTWQKFYQKYPNYREVEP